MRAFEHLLIDTDAEGDERVATPSRRLSDSTCFWVSYSLFMVAVGALSMWAFFKYIVMA
jgi:hypothetical protein